MTVLELACIIIICLCALVDTLLIAWIAYLILCYGWRAF